MALPLLGLCTMLMILLTSWVSPGPVFFMQDRVGYMGRRFKIYKFRTMRMGADCSVHQQHYQELIRTNAPMVKLDSRGDTRLIPFGWLIRSSGLDELPQLINVLRGEMSLVGPRPCIPSEFAQYVSWQRQRCNALPGLTGLWQVSGKNRTTFEEMIHLDLKYAREFSPWLDLKILLLTTPCLFAQIREIRRARLSPAVAAPRTSGALAVKMKAHALSVQTRHAQPAPSEASTGLNSWLEQLRPDRSAPQSTARFATPRPVASDKSAPNEFVGGAS